MNLHSLFLVMGFTVDHEGLAKAMVGLHGLQMLANAAASAITGMAHELVDMAVTSAHAGTHLMGLSAGLGMSLRSVQEWSYVAQQAGTNADAFARGLGMFERNLRSFAAGRGSKGFRDGMAEIGISAQNAKEMLAGPDGMNSALFQVSDHYLKLGVTAERAALNQQLFGARNREIAHDLGRGSAVLREQIATVHEIGGILGDKQVDDLKKLDNSIKQLGTSFKTLGMSVVADLAPQIIGMINEVTKWIGANKDLISNVLMGLFQALGVVFRVLFAFVRLFVAAMDGNAGAIAVVSLLAAGFIGLVYILGMLLMPLVQGLILAFTALDIAAAPFITIGLAIAAAIALILLLITNWSDVVDVLGVAFGALYDGLAWIIHLPRLIIRHWEEIKFWFAAFGGWFLDKMRGIGESVVSFFKGLGSGIVGALQYVANLFLEPLQWAINKAIGMLNHIPGINFSKVSLTLGEAAAPARPTLSPAASAAFNAFGAPGGNMAGELSGAGPGRTGARTPNASFGKATTQHVSIGPTTINIHGVKDAAEAKDHIADHVDNVHRHAVAGLGGEVQ